MKTKIQPLLTHAFTLVLGFVIGFLLSLNFRPGWAKDGAYFCCDVEGAPCVLSPDGDCTTPLQWCSQTGEKPDGTVYCSEW